MYCKSFLSLSLRLAFGSFKLLTFCNDRRLWHVLFLLRNLFCVIPQLIDTLYTGMVAEYAGESAVLRVAAGWGFAAAVAAVLFL